MPACTHAPTHQSTNWSQVKCPSGTFVNNFLKYMGPGIFMLFVFAVVIPGFWFAAVYMNRDNLEVRAAGRGWLRGMPSILGLLTSHRCWGA